ncbi:hypothetical protein HYT55_03780 [Candidatus Woesearchaeota archaeon]|nr:hypothetical protein [Candidatus Woesearchaeota archaeon]
MLTKQELLRQILHLIIGVVVVTLLYYEILTSLSLFLLIVIGILASFISKRKSLPLFHFFLKHLEREEQRKTFPGRGLIFFFIGVLLVIQLFPQDIAFASIMVLAFGDSISHIVGERFGQLKNIFNGKSKKLLEGTVAGALVGFLAAAIFVPLSQAFLGSFAAMIAEVIEIDFNQKPVDDNVVVPLVAGTVMYLLVTYL